jgi:hypothetical protein
MTQLVALQEALEFYGVKTFLSTFDCVGEHAVAQVDYVEGYAHSSEGTLYLIVNKESEKCMLK